MTRKQKRKIARFVKAFLMTCLFWFGLIGTSCVIEHYESTYSRLAICSNYACDVYEFTDNTGNIWEWEPDSCLEYYEIGKAYRLIMFDKKTSTIYDDTILKIKKN